MAIHDIPIYVRTSAAKKAGEMERKVFESLSPNADFQDLKRIAERLSESCEHVRCNRTKEAFVRGFAV